MDIGSILTSSFALIFVLSLIGIISLLYRKYAQGIDFKKIKDDKPKKRINIIEVKNIDAKKKIVLFSKDEKEFIAVFSENSVKIIE